MLVDEELTDPTIPRPYVGEEALKVVNSIFGQTLRAIFTAIAEVNDMRLPRPIDFTALATG